MRKIVLPIHIACAVSLLGADLSLIVLGASALGGGPPEQSYPAMSDVATYVMLPLAAATLVSGLTLLRVSGHHRRELWVAAKLTITVILATVLASVLVPALQSAADTDPSNKLLPVLGPVASLVLLAVNIVLGTSKPGGRRSRRPAGRISAERSLQP